MNTKEQKRVDVLAVMDAARASMGMRMPGELDSRRAEMAEARAAVAELIVKSQTASVLLRSLIDALGDTEFTDGDLEVADELDAALARIGGAA